MEKLQPSGWGIVVDKSNATETFHCRGTVFQKGSRLNYERNPRSRTNNPSKEGNLSTIGAIAIFLLFLLVFCLLIYFGIVIADLFI